MKRCKAIHALCACFVCVFSLIAFSCSDEIISESAPGNNSDSFGNFSVIDLPGVIGVGVIQNDTQTTRADQTSDGRPLADGLSSEYALAEPVGGELYHYLLLYDRNNDGATPFIFQIDATEKETDQNDKNVTLTVSKLFSKENTDANNIVKEFNSTADFINFFKDMKPYVLLNFKLTDEPSNYSLNGNTIAGSTTLEKLSGLTRAQLEALQMTDYKVSGRGSRNYFIMSNSVYSDYSQKIIDGTFNSKNIFPTEEEAKANPGLTVYVDRLASKVTVSFNTSLMGQADFDKFDQKQIITGIGINPSTGLPELDMKVEKVDMTHVGGIVFNNDGYEIRHQTVNAKLRIIGYGLSNLEPKTNLFKDINYLLSLQSVGNWQWTDKDNHRSYWSRDLNYGLVKSTGGKFTKVEGYPHQFRLALDTDSVTAYHGGGYNDRNDGEEYKIGENKYISYSNLGTIDLDSRINGVVLNYKSFNQLKNEFSNYRSENSSGGTNGFSFSPLYSLENTYYDQGQLTTGNWVWPWNRAPYAAATNLVILAEIQFEDGAYSLGQGSDEGENEENPDKGNDSNAASTHNVTYDNSTLRDVYLGQNNIFYLKKENLLKSKLHILNKVMLSGGNAGIQILHGQWDRHSRWDEDDENQNLETHLDKVAWNEGSVLWFAETEMEGGNPIVKESPPDKEGKIAYKVVLKRTVQLPVTDDIKYYLDLIPAEISGGDGQRLIAPHEDWMGKQYRYYLAPVTHDDQGNEKMDEDKAVEISFNHLVALIHKIIGPIDVYTEGKMYFSVPIPHRINSFSSTSNREAWRNFGAFSIVRNNWYNVQVTELTRMGTPVDDLDQPIVPVMDIKRSYINMGVQVLDWHEIIEDNIPMM